MTDRNRIPIDEHFGACAFRLSMRGWRIVVLFSLLFCFSITPIWRSLESLEYDNDYRVPYELSKDYWLYERHATRRSGDAAPCYVLGDSVVWGEYVRADGTLSHFLNQGRADTPFVNAGINGVFPLALEGLVRYHMPAIRNKDVLLHCNLLWMSSRDADMSATKEQTFNHVALVPQFRPRIPCYRAEFNERLGITIRRRLDVFGWVGHLQQCYFEQRDIPAWTLQDDGQLPPTYPNAWRMPFSQITLAVPNESKNEGKRGPDSARHRPWFENGMMQQSFKWIGSETSLQWSAFQRLALVLKRRGNRVLVVVGPFNEHLVRDEDLPGLNRWKQTVAQWCRESDLRCQVPQPLPSEMYGDASHPLTEGYAVLAEMLQPYLD